MRPWISFLENGSIPADLQNTLLKPHPVNTARQWHEAVVADMRRQGWLVETEHSVRDLSTGRSGRIDIKADRWGCQTVYIELDRCNPRKKSIQKLRTTSGARVVVCRYHQELIP